MYKALVNIGITPTGPEFAVGDTVPEDYPHLQVLIERGYVEQVATGGAEDAEASEGDDPLKPKRKK